jgi:hypothetical protein
MKHPEKRKRSFGLAPLAVVAVLGIAAFVATHRASGSVTYAHHSTELDRARARRYRPMTSDLRPNEAAWVFDGRYPIRGTVMSTWDADTAANREACRTAWLKSPPYIGFCRGLSDNRIAAVLLTEIDGESIVYVPVNRIAGLHQGDRVVVRIAGTAAADAVQTLPVLMNVLKWGRAPLHDAHD